MVPSEITLQITTELSMSDSPSVQKTGSLTKSLVDSTFSSTQRNTSSILYGMFVSYDKFDLPVMKSSSDELIVIGNNLQYVSEVWLHISPSCSMRTNGTVEMKIHSRSPTHLVAMIKKEEKYREEWRYPIFVCTKPKSKLPEFNSIIIQDNRDPLLPLLYVIYCAFLLLSALFTGLNLSLMSLDLEDLRRIREYDENPNTRRYAANIIPIRENGNFTLCTILLGNTICNAIDVLTFDRITLNLELLDWERILLINIVPAMFIIIFSEVIPQVICTKFALPIGSRFRHLMVFFMVITYPASYPLSKLLDWIVGKEVRSTMDRRMLGDLMRQQKSDTANMAVVVENAMMLQVRRVRDVMTPLEKVFMMSDRTEVNVKLKRQLSENRHTRIPVYKGDDRNCIIGVLNVKDLLLIDDSLDIHVGAIMQLWNRSTLFRFVSSEAPVVQLMLELKKGFPLAIVVDYQHDKKCYHVTGIVTLEDHLEEVIGEINDEKDVNVRSRPGIAVDRSAAGDIATMELALKKVKKRAIITPTEEDKTDEKAPLLQCSTQPATPLKPSLSKKKSFSSSTRIMHGSREESRPQNS